LRRAESHIAKMPALPWRAVADPVILSTLPHFLALCFVLGRARAGSALFAAYAAVIAASAALSIAWHAQHERKNWVFWADYALALAWTLMDFAVAYATQPGALPTVAIANATVLVANWLTDHWAREGTLPYATGHSAWHLLSCAKSIYVAHLLGSA
jgi:hypothetical protein